jgi:hypothetical protein
MNYHLLKNRIVYIIIQMVNSNNNCDAILKDPFFNNSICGSSAKWKVKEENENDYIHLRCGRHARNLDRISLYDKKNENFNININKNVNNKEKYFNLEDLLKYIESGQYKKDIPIEIENLFKEIDILNDNIESILK